MKSTCENCGTEKLTNDLCPKCLAKDVRRPSDWNNRRWMDVIAVLLAIGSLVLIAVELAKAF